MANARDRRKGHRPSAALIIRNCLLKIFSGTTCTKYSAHVVRNDNCDLIYLLVQLATFVPQSSRGLECIR